jgi:hypothetical protein
MRWRMTARSGKGCFGLLFQQLWRDCREQIALASTVNLINGKSSIVSSDFGSMDFSPARTLLFNLLRRFVFIFDYQI